MAATFRRVAGPRRRDGYEELYKECFADLKAHDFDTGYLAYLQHKIEDYFVALADQTGEEYNLTMAGVDWRMFLEYALRQIPKSDIALREILLGYICDKWERQRYRNVKDDVREWMKRFDEILKSRLNSAIDTVFYELRANQVIPPDTPRVEMDEGGTIYYPEGTSDADYQFGSVRNEVLKWSAPLNQLARALNAAEPQLGFDRLTAYEICKRVGDSKKVQLSRGKFESVRKFLEQIHRRDADFKTEDYVPEAAGIILSLLRET